MTPELDRRASVVLGSPYWDIKDSKERMKRLDEFYSLRDAIREVDTYDELSPDMKKLFDRAGAEADKANKEHEEFVQNDWEGYGRFHSTSI